MKNLTVKNIQKFRTDDGYAWSATFYLDGKRIGPASDQGFGGEVNTRELNPDALAKIEAYAKTLPKFGGDMNLEQDAAMVLEAVMWDVVDQRHTKALLKRKIIARLPDGKIYEWRIKKGLSVELAIATFKTQYPDTITLNSMPLEEANRILHPTEEDAMKDFKLQ